VELADLIKRHRVDQVVFSYSDVSHEDVMHKASVVLAAGADFVLLGPRSTMLKARKPVVAVCAVRTGAGKSPVSRRVCGILRMLGLRVVVVRHPMPYGNLLKELCQRIASYRDLGRYGYTIEEREEFEPHIANGCVVYDGVDYGVVLEKAEAEGDVLVWDGGNNDFPFYKPDLLVVVADALRPGHEVKYHPGETNLRMADVVIVNKVGSARAEDVQVVVRNVKESNPTARIILADSVISVDKPELIKGRRVLVVEDGPTVTHGGMSYGAGFVAAQRFGAEEVVDVGAFAVGSIKEALEKYKHLGRVLPAMGYGAGQIEELERTINACDCDSVVVGTPIDLGRLLRIDKPTVRVRYEIEEIGHPNLEDVLRERLGRS
jgi:predicted GTPase